MKSLFYEMPQPDLTNAPYGRVTYPVSHSYNGGVIVDGKRYAGYRVPKPLLRNGDVLVDIGMGLQLNSHPPTATKLLKKLDS